MLVSEQAPIKCPSKIMCLLVVNLATNVLIIHLVFYFRVY